MLSRFFLRPSNLRLVTLVSSKSHPQIFSSFLRLLSTNSGGDRNGNGYNRSDDPWRFSKESEGKFDSTFGEDSRTPSGVLGSDSLAGEDDWQKVKDDEEDVFKGIEKEEARAKGGDEWSTAEEYNPWSLTEEVKDHVFSIGDEEARSVESSGESAKADYSEQRKLIEREEKEFASRSKGGISQESEWKFDSTFGQDSRTPSGVLGSDSLAGEEDWLKVKDDEGDVFEGIEKEEKRAKGGDEWLAVDEHKPWSLTEEVKDHVFDIGNEEALGVERSEESTNAYYSEQRERIEREEKELSAIIKGPDRAFGDLITKSGITDEMLDSLIALKDFQGVEGLPPLTEIEDMRYEKSLKKSSRADIELQMQEEMAKSRVRQVDEKGRAYGTGRRKCSIARVWIEPGDGKFLVNDKDFDVYFPVLDHRAALLRPLAETKTLGLWNVKCTVKGGGVTGQVGAIQLGVSRALQNWEPDLRPPLRSAGFLTRDSRVVERKKPGKAKARKSFQWVKR